MRKTNWLLILSLGCSGVTLAAGLAVWLSLQNRPLPPLNLPEHADARTYAGLALELAAQERFSEALEVNARALSYSPSHPELLYNQAWLEASLGRWQQALSLIERAKPLARDDEALSALRVWVLRQLGRQREAAAEFKRIKDWQPADPYTRARLHQLAGRDTQALAAFNQALIASPVPQPAFWYWRSRSYQALHQPKQALADLDRLLARKPDAALYLERAALHEQLGELPQALDDLARSLALDPRRETRLARARLNLDLYPQASLQELEALLKADPGWLPAQLLQIRALLNARQLKPAQAAMTRVLAAHPANGEAWWLQGVLQRVRRKYPEALAAQTQARRHGYSGTEVELELARLAAQRGLQPEARLRVTQLLQRQPELKARLEQDRLLKRLVRGQGRP